MFVVSVGTYRAERVHDTGTLDDELIVYEGDDVIFSCRAQPDEGPVTEEELLEWLDYYLFDAEVQ